jgi:hypothetical protein
MIDVSKIKVGDEVTVRAKVVGTGSNGLETRVGAGLMWFHHREIATHTPAPREFKPGDRVKKTNWGDASIQWTFIASANGLAFCAHDNTVDVMTVMISELCHADESE